MAAWGGLILVTGWLSLAAPGWAFLEVPASYPTIQAAIDAAADGDVVLVAPGVYRETLVIANKTIVLASHFLVSEDPAAIDETVIDGAGGDYAIRIASGAGEGTTIQGFTIRNADDAVTARARFALLNSRVTGAKDGIDYEGGSGGLVRDCVFEDNTDDGIDLDDDVDVVIERSVIRDNGDDGIEVRLHDYTGPTLAIVIRNNLISGNGEDGIQLIGDTAESARTFHIERNRFVANAMAGVGMMCCMNTLEDLEGASLPERVYLIHNTFVANDHGISGGDDAIVLNNVFAHTRGVALKRLDGNSVAAYNLFFGNGTDQVESNLDGATSVFADPLLDAAQRPSRRSPAIDAGTALFAWGSEPVLNRSAGDYLGEAPDLGAFEVPAGWGRRVPFGCGLGGELPLLLFALRGMRRAGQSRGASHGGRRGGAGEVPGRLASLQPR